MYPQMNITSDMYEIFNNSIIPIIIIDGEFTLLYFNRKFALLTGYSQKRITLKSSLHDYIKIKNFKKLINTTNSVDQNQTSHELDAICIKEGNKLRLLSQSFTFIENNELKILLQFIDMSLELKLHFDYKMLEYIEQTKHNIEQRLELSNTLLQHRSSFAIAKESCTSLGNIYPNINLIFLKRNLSNDKDGHSIEYIYPEIKDNISITEHWFFGGFPEPFLKREKDIH